MDNATLRKVQLVQLEIVKEIDSVCAKYNIKYFLIGGTLIGAIRHKGFIPWDDDLDIGMFRDDYEKFQEIAPKTLGDNYRLIDWKSDSNYPHPMGKVIKKGTVYKECKRKDKGEQGIWVDVFPYDNVESKKALSKKAFRLKVLRSIIRAKDKYQTWVTPDGVLWGKYIKNIPFRILALFANRDKVIEKYERLSCESNNKECEFVFENGVEEFSKWCFPKEYFKELKYVEFEDTYLLAPVKYDEYLKTCYGNYMELPPVEEREGKHLIEEVDFGE